MSFRFDDDNEFEEVDEEETDEESEDEDEESDEDESDDADDEPDEGAEERLERIEKAFRAERTKVRACDDVAALRTMRRDYQEILASAVGVGRLRMNDLIETVDEQVTNLKAKRFAAGRP